MNQAGPNPPTAHVENAFAFQVRAPLHRLAPLFGAWEERAWAGADWDPEFLHPQPARDQRGAVFTIAHGAGRSVWVNTAFDPAGGFFQYTYVAPGVQAVLITIRARALGSAETAVDVEYQRTALDPFHNAAIEDLGRKDAASGPEWAAAIEACLGVE